MRSPRLEVRDETSHAADVRRRDQGVPAEPALPLRRLPLVQVLLPALVPGQLAGAGGLQALGGAPLGLDLRHGDSVLSVASGSESSPGYALPAWRGSRWTRCRPCPWTSDRGA